MQEFPVRREGLLYLTEGGQETEAMYRHGHDLPEFALFTLLDRPEGLAALQQMYHRFLATAVEAGCVPVMGGLDYRLSPDWVARLGYPVEAIPEIEHRCIEFLRDVVATHEEPLPEVLISGIVGPWGDAYGPGREMTADEAQAYHSPQINAMAAERVDLVQAMTFTRVPEAVGVARAAAEAGLPVSISFTLDTDHRLFTGHSLREAIETVDAEAGDAAPNFYGINCSHPDEFIPALEPGSWVERIRILRPNASPMGKIALCQIGHLEEGDPPELARQMAALTARYPHIDIVGGCCGTWTDHLAEMAREIAASGGRVQTHARVEGLGRASAG